MNKATPIPDLIEHTGRGLDLGSCRKCGGRIVRNVGPPRNEYPWWHINTGLTICQGEGND